MPHYHYQYVDAAGKRKSGVIESKGDREAKQQLREQGVLVTQFSVKGKMGGKQQLKGDNLMAFTMQLSQLVNAGIPLFESLTALEEQSRGETYHSVTLSLCEKIRSGSSLSAAMETFPDSFDKLYCGMVASGEAVGVLGPVLEKLAAFLSRSMRLKKQITTALIYPAILGGFSMIIICALMGFVVPALEGIFADRPLNAFTAMILTLSRLFRTYWWLYLPVVAGGVTFAVWKLRSDAGRIWFEKTVLKIPLIRTLAVQTAVARFCRTLGTLLQGGLSMIDSLRIARGVMRNVVLESEIQRAEVKIIEGKSLSAELKRSSYFPPLISRMLAVGEESGATASMLGRIADMYEAEIEKTLDRVMAMAQPVILIVMGIVIGSVMLAILLPLTDVSSFSIG